MAGYLGEKLTKVVRISPQKDNPFKILGVKPSHPDYIKCSLRSMNSGSVTEYEVIVENIYNKAGSYNDTILVKTNNSAVPELDIPVNAYILQPQPGAAGK